MKIPMPDGSVVEMSDDEFREHCARLFKQDKGLPNESVEVTHSEAVAMHLRDRDHAPLFRHGR